MEDKKIKKEILKKLRKSFDSKTLMSKQTRSDSKSINSEWVPFDFDRGVLKSTSNYHFSALDNGNFKMSIVWGDFELKTGE